MCKTQKPGTGFMEEKIYFPLQYSFKGQVTDPTLSHPYLNSYGNKHFR